ncbi:MAG: bifunctional [glutamine synthetase] adenylyltransferase/[glutamine synthetase]-adenylyl-L-tyrosine phosphorylase [Actinomycetes bacterium]
MSNPRRPPALDVSLARIGFADPARAQSLLADPALAGLVDPLEDVFDDGLLRALGETADPDLALLGLVRLLESLHAASPDGGSAEPGRLHAALLAGGQLRDRLLAVLGASAALADHLVHHPEHWTAVAKEPPTSPAEPRDDLLAGVGADPATPAPVAAAGGTAGYDRLRVAYRRPLLTIAAHDLSSRDPTVHVASVSERLADLAAAALDAALAVARAELPEQAEVCRIAVLGMGKCGGRELNYVSDVDVVYVVEPVGDADEATAVAAGTRLASALARACSAVTAEGTLWPVDAALRPEGKDGPLVRTLASHLAYYERWAKTWEFQALLKARPVAGDRLLGEAYVEALRPLVWGAAQRPNFVEDVRAMRRRVEQNVPARDAERQLKLGSGGLRDVEFSVQLLQLVHGPADDRIRSGNTWEALAALSATGYVGRDDADTLDAAYRFLRVLEHRIQLYRLRRSHVLPASPGDLRRLARSSRLESAEVLEKRWRETRVTVRRLHERLFYRPLLPAAARLHPDEARLSPDAAKARLSALGYRDPPNAMRHLAALTEGVSRRAAIQRQLLPVLLGWFADGADPDAGLLAFRKVSDELGTTHWYLKMLRDSGAAAERMAHVLASSRFAAELLERAPESTQWLGSDADLAPRGRDLLCGEVAAALARHEDVRDVVQAVRAVRRRELLRTAVADLSGLLDLRGVGEALTDVAAAVLDCALQAVCRSVAARRYGGRLPARLAVIGMGRLGGAEMGYGSDADVLFVHEPLDGAGDGEAAEAATAVVTELQKVLREPGPEPPLDVDSTLRPEGRNGPVVRSLASYREYYERWSLVWESQALLRASPLAGDEQVGEAFVRLVDPLRYPASGLSRADVREVRRIKARVESERLPRNVDPRRHVKLGPGGLADVEWTVQLLQLRYAAEQPALRTTSTLQALDAATAASLVVPDHAAELEAAWVLASRLRNAVTLWRGRQTDVIPADPQDREGVARILGYPPGSAETLEEDYRRRARHARSVMERIFYA